MRIHPSLLVPWSLRWQGRICVAFGLSLICVIGYLNPQKAEITTTEMLHDPTDVLVARQDILPGELLTSEKLVIEPRYPETLPSDPIHSFGAIKGARAAGLIPLGYPISAKLVAKQQ
jgi:hypothetical protein